MKRLLIGAALLSVVPSTQATMAQQHPVADGALASVINSVNMRNIGPFRSGAWVTSIAVPTAPPREHLYTIYAGVRSGGLWKTSNNGITWEPVTDSMGTIASVGAVAVAPSNSRIVWVGGGDQANARSSMSGDGVFKSIDGGRTWQARGLTDTHHIARIVIHPKNPDIIYVAAMGHLFSKNAERGVFRSMDGGATWKKVLYINDGVGAIDLVINEKTPTQIFAAMYDKERLPWQIVESGPESGVYRSDDAGEKWTRLTKGLPGGKIGRIGLDIYQRNPLILYALLENQNQKENAGGGPVNSTSPLAKGILGNELYRTDDGGKTWRKVSGDVNVAGGKAPYSFNQLKINPFNDQHVVVTSDSMFQSKDGGKAWTDVTEALGVVEAGAPGERWVSRVFASPHDAATAFVSKTGFRNDDFRPYLYRTTDSGVTWTSIASDLPNCAVNVVVQDRKTPNLLYVGNDRGVWVSIDAGTHWTRLQANLPAVAVHDLTLHPRENDLVLGTYGRGLWTGDVSFMPEVTADVLKKSAYLFDIEPKARYGFGPQGMNYKLYGDKFLSVPNEPEAIVINYYLKADQPAGAKVTVTDVNGRVMRHFDGPGKAGMNRVLWSLAGGSGRGSGGGGGGGGGGAEGGGRAGTAGPAIPATVGDYAVTVEVAGEKLTKAARVRERVGR